MRILSLHYVRRRSGGEVELSLDDGTVVTLDPDLVVQHRLETGRELSPAALEAVKRAQERLSARRRLIRYLSLRRKTAREAERYLRELRFSEEAVQEAVQAAREMGYLDDGRFAETYTLTQDRARKGPRAIRQELLMRGIDQDLADEAVTPLEPPDAQRARAREAAARRAEQLHRSEPDRRKARLKLTQFLLRRGFDGDICTEVAEELLGGGDSENSE